MYLIPFKGLTNNSHTKMYSQLQQKKKKTITQPQNKTYFGNKLEKNLKFNVCAQVYEYYSRDEVQQASKADESS